MEKRLQFFVFILALAITTISGQEYLVQGARPVYIISHSGEEPEPEARDVQITSEMLARSGLSSSEEEIVKEALAEEETQKQQTGRKNGTARMPPDFTDSVNSNRRFPPRRRRPLKADPGNIDREYDNEPAAPTAAPKSGLSRFLWPFSVSVSKSKGPLHHGHGHGPPHHLGLDDEDVVEYDAPEPIPAHGFDPDKDPEVQKLRVEIYKEHKRKKKWKKIVKHDLAEIAAIGLTKAITFMEFI